MERTSRRRLASRAAGGALAVAGAVSVHACDHDWNKYDPLLGGATSGTSASSSSSGGGSGGASSSSSSGGSTGACMKTAPVEDCTTPADDDCDGQTNDHCGVWSEGFSGNSVQQGYAVAVTPDAGVVAFTGFDEGDTHFAGKQLNTANAGQTFVVAFTQAAAGPAFLWGHEFGYGKAYSLAFDPESDLLVAGRFGTSLLPCPTQAPLTSKTAQSIFVVKYDPQGNCRFARGFGDGSNDSWGLAVAGDATGVYLGGWFRGHVDFGDGVPVSPIGQNAAVLVKLVDDGMGGTTTPWKVIFDGFGGDQVSAVALEPQGDVILGGSYSQSATFDGKMLPTNGSTSALVARLAGADGAVIWSRDFTTPTTGGEVRPTSVAVDPASGDVLVAGVFSGATDFSGLPAPDAGAPGCGVLTSTNTSGDDVFVLRLAGTGGACLWARSFGRNISASPVPSIACGPGCGAAPGAECVVVGLTTTGRLDVGSWPLTADGEDVALFTLDAKGTPLWARLFGGSDQQELNGIAVDASGGIYLTGSYKGSIAFSATQTLDVTVDAVNPDGFLARIAAP